MLHTFCGPGCSYGRWKWWKQCQLSMAFSENVSNILKHSTPNLRNIRHLTVCQGHLSPIFSSEWFTVKAERKSTYIKVELKHHIPPGPAIITKLFGGSPRRQFGCSIQGELQMPNDNCQWLFQLWTAAICDWHILPGVLCHNLLSTHI